MSSLRVSFSEQNDVVLVKAFETEIHADLYYSPQDYQRFHYEEELRWQYAIQKALAKKRKAAELLAESTSQNDSRNCESEQRTDSSSSCTTRMQGSPTSKSTACAA